MDIAQAASVITEAMEAIGVAASKAHEAKEKIHAVLGSGFELEPLREAYSEIDQADGLLGNAYAKCQEAL